MHKLSFTKIQAQGNSYVFLDCIRNPLPELNLTKLARFLANKSFGIGSDGMVLMLPDSEADLLMRIWNSDGSEAQSCGSALRSVVAYLHNRRSPEKTEYRIKTLSGIVRGTVLEVSSDYNTAIDFNKVESLLMNGMTDDECINNLLSVNDWIGLPVNVGNPHFVLIDRLQTEDFEKLDELDIDQIAEELHQDERFAEGFNIEFVRIIDRDFVKARVWEVGSGETLACGTGACALVYAGIRLGFLDNSVKVEYPGGSVLVELECLSCICRLSGKVRFVSDGEVYYAE